MTALPEAAALEGVQNQLLAAHVRHCSHGGAKAGGFTVKIWPGYEVDHVDQRVALLQQKQPALPVDLVGVLVGIAVVDVNKGAVPQQDRPGYSGGTTSGKPDVKSIVAGKGVDGALYLLQRGGGEHCPVTDHAQLQQHKRGKVWVAGLQLGQLFLFCMVHCSLLWLQKPEPDQNCGGQANQKGDIHPTEPHTKGHSPGCVVLEPPRLHGHGKTLGALQRVDQHRKDSFG